MRLCAANEMAAPSSAGGPITRAREGETCVSRRYQSKDPDSARARSFPGFPSPSPSPSLMMRHPLVLEGRGSVCSRRRAIELRGYVQQPLVGMAILNPLPIPMQRSPRRSRSRECEARSSTTSLLRSCLIALHCHRARVCCDCRCLLPSPLPLPNFN